MDTACVNRTSETLCPEESSGLLAVIIIPSLLGLSTVLVVVLILLSLHRNRQRLHGSRPHVTDAQQSVSLSPAPVPPQVQASLAPWELPDDFVLEGLEFWQPGRYGPICKGRLRRRDGGGGSDVVVKSLRDGPDQPEAQEFLRFLQFQATVCKHENVVQMWFCQTRRLPLVQVSEALSPGNLLHFLWTLRDVSQQEDTGQQTCPLQTFSERSVFLVAKQVAAGLDFLVSEHRLVHGDVAARSLLLGPGLHVRVSGLGVAFEGREPGPGVRRRTAAVPVKWQAPERILMQLSLDRSDVWSFGILLYELITLGSPPYPELEPQAVLPKLQASYRMKRPKHCGGSLYDLMKYCWMWSFKDRPTFSAVMKLLEASLHFTDMKPIKVPEAVDISDYNRKAGLLQ